MKKFLLAAAFAASFTVPALAADSERLDLTYGVCGDLTVEAHKPIDRPHGTWCSYTKSYVMEITNNWTGELKAGEPWGSGLLWSSTHMRVLSYRSTECRGPMTRNDKTTHIEQFCNDGSYTNFTLSDNKWPSGYARSINAEPDKYGVKEEEGFYSTDTTIGVITFRGKRTYADGKTKYGKWVNDTYMGVF